MLQDARAHFPELVGYLLCIGMPVGVGLGIRGALRSSSADRKFAWGRAIVAGGVSGALGGLIFGRWVSSGDYFPLLVGFGELSSRPKTIALHFLVAFFIGVFFGLLFQKDVRGYGSCMGWGLGFGIFWWFLGPLTLSPLAAGMPIDWSADGVGKLRNKIDSLLLRGADIRRIRLDVQSGLAFVPAEYDRECRCALKSIGTLQEFL